MTHFLEVVGEDTSMGCCVYCLRRSTSILISASLEINYQLSIDTGSGGD